MGVGVNHTGGVYGLGFMFMLRCTHTHARTHTHRKVMCCKWCFPAVVAIVTGAGPVLVCLQATT